MQEQQNKPEQGEAPALPGRVAVMSTKDIITYKDNIQKALARRMKPRSIRRTAGLSLAEYNSILNFEAE